MNEVAVVGMMEAGGEPLSELHVRRPSRGDTPVTVRAAGPCDQDGDYSSTWRDCSNTKSNTGGVTVL